MGKATIASGGTDGLYQVTLDYGQAARDARLAKINSDLAALVGKIAAAQASLDAQQAIEDAQKVVVDAAIDAYITVSNTPEAPASALENTLKNYTDAATALAKIKGDTAALRIPLDVLKSEQAQLKKDQSTWTALVLTETVSAWCADLTEDASGLVATVEIPGENALVLIAPAAPAPTAADGALAAREVQSPEQVFWNAAVLPGWQRWKPTYRLGTITALDVEADTASVTLDAAYSSAQGLNVNQATSLTAVPVVYMSCNALAFEVGDRCVVAFTGQSQDAPKVIGFRDHPKACAPEFVLVPITAPNPTELVDEGSYTAFDSISYITNPECGWDVQPTSAVTLTQVSESYEVRRIVAGGTVEIIGDTMGWGATEVSQVILWEEIQGVDVHTASANVVAHRTYNKSWFIDTSYGRLIIASHTWPWAEYSFPTHFIVAPYCALKDYLTAFVHKFITVIVAQNPSIDILGYPVSIPAVYSINTSDVNDMAAFLETATKMPPTVPLSLGSKVLEYEYDGITTKPGSVKSLYVKYKRPGAG